MSDDELTTVRLLGLPLALAVEAQEHFDELSREFLHLANADDEVRRDVPGRLVELSNHLRSRFSSFTSENQRRMDEAAARGDETIDLTYHVPKEAAPAALQLADLLDEADRYCSSGEYLLTLTTPPDALRYRRWYLAQFVDQIGGAPPVPFSDWPPAG